MQHASKLCFHLHVFLDCIIVDDTSCCIRMKSVLSSFIA